MSPFKDIIDAVAPISIFLFGVSLTDVNNGLQFVSFIVSILYVVVRIFLLIKTKKENEDENFF